MYYICLIALIISNFCYANELWDKIRSTNLVAGKNYQISSGTGFFIANHYFITNNHVVTNCINIAIRGAVDPAVAKIIMVDSVNDLALLYTEANNIEIASLRSNDGLKPNDELIIIGYPLTHSDDGTVLITNSKPIGDESDITKLKEIQFVANIDHGNSGGPVLDSSGNVIGVVQGVRKYYHESDPTNAFKTIGIAIGLSRLEDFIFKSNIYSYKNISTDLVTNYNVNNRAQKYIVNIHCMKE